MATNKVVAVTTIPTKTGDTVASYNVYSSSPAPGTSLGTMTTGEAAAGKTFSLTDGVTHSITVKAVWTAGGESTLSSNAVSVNLTIAAPTSLAVGTPTSDSLPLTWTKSTTGVMTAYRVYDDGVLLQTFSGDVAAGTLTGLTASTTYTNLTVRAYNGTSESASSNAVNGTTTAVQGEVAFSTSGGANNIGFTNNGTLWTAGSGNTGPTGSYVLGEQVIIGDGYIVAEVTANSSTATSLVGMMLAIRDANTNGLYDSGNVAAFGVGSAGSTYQYLITSTVNSVESAFGDGPVREVGDLIRISRTSGVLKFEYYRSGSWTEIVHGLTLAASLATDNLYVQMRGFNSNDFDNPKILS